MNCIKLKRFAYFLFGLLFCKSVQGESIVQAKWQQKVDYTIQVQLNDSTHTLDGFVTIQYHNNSPDTLQELYIHLWPNAYSRNNTPFAKQQLVNGHTDFFYAKEKDMGSIYNLSFKSGNKTLAFTVDSSVMDIAKLQLAKPILPGQNRLISTTFQVKIPYGFSRMGKEIRKNGAKDYQITQWFPKVAMYDVDGWHAMSYLDLGEFYDNFGDYEVEITIPSQYMVAATGIMETNLGETKWRKKVSAKEATVRKGNGSFKTLLFKQKNIHDFAWFASNNFIEFRDEVKLESGKLVETKFYGKRENKSTMHALKGAIAFYSNKIGDYPYSSCSVVEGALLAGGGMEYPMITVISYMTDRVVVHEVGHNWFQGILATNERKNPWMDEGMNSYYENLYFKENPPLSKGKENKISSLVNEITENQSYHICRHQQHLIEDQAAGLESEAYTEMNYGAIVYGKVAYMFEYLEKELGSSLFDSCMQAYYAEWKFKHPLPKDIQNSFEKTAGRDLDWFFVEAMRAKGDLKFNSKGPYLISKGKKEEKERKRFSINAIGFDSPEEKQLHVLPLLGWNEHNKIMLGATFFNEFVFAKKTRFQLSPMYSFEDKNINGFASLEKRLKTSIGKWYRTDLGVKLQSFDYTVNSNKLHYTRIKPYINIHLKPQDKFYLGRKNVLQFAGYYIHSSGDSAERFRINKRMHLLGRYAFDNNKALNNTKLNLVLEYGKDGLNTVEASQDYLKASVTWKQELNYKSKGKKLKFRVFAGKFLYKSDSSVSGIYQIRLSDNTGISDYLMDDLFLFRSPGFKTDFHTRQLTENGGAMRNPISTQVTDAWLIAVNIESTLPGKIPIRPYFDIGMGKSGASAGGLFNQEFIYTGGFSIVIAEDILEVYVPLLSSEQLVDRYDFSDIDFLQRISFKLNLSLANPLKLLKI